MSLTIGAGGALGLCRASSRVRPVLRPNTPFLVAVRNHWNKDYKPGAYPETPEARQAAAKKYNLPEEWYDVYPNDGFGYGDYPKLPKVSEEARDDFYPWDYPEAKRNYNELIHVDEENMNSTRYNYNMRHRVPLWQQYLALGGTIAFFTALYIYCEDYDRKMTSPILAKQYPQPGVVHYTFEPMNS